MTPPAEPIFVTGGGGFVGTAVVRRLLEGGHTVWSSDPGPPRADLSAFGARLHLIPGSVEDAPGLEGALRASEARRAIALAAFSTGDIGLGRSGEADSRKAMAVNVQGFFNLLEAAHSAGVRRVVFASSTVVYGPAATYPKPRLAEADAKNPQHVYGLTKHLAEEIARFFREVRGVETCGVRLPLVIGPGLWYRGAAAPLMELFASAGAGGEHRVEGPAEPFDLAHVADVAELFLRLVRHEGPPAPLYNLDGFTTTYAEIAATAERLVPGLRVRFTAKPAPLVYPLVDTGRLRRDLGFAPHFDLEATVRDCLDKLRPAGGRRPDEFG